MASSPKNSSLTIKPLLIALLIRSLSLLSQTFFQPDEFYQALEPAHLLVFGYGYQTWEWRNLPAPNVEGMGGIKRWLVLLGGGRLRGWLWPSLFAGIYWVLRETGSDGTYWIALAPRIPLVFIAALTDYSTYLLARKILGPRTGNTALFLSLTNLFHAHALPRALSTSPETLLTTFALLHWPLPQTYSRESRYGLGMSLAASAVAFAMRPTGAILWVGLGGWEGWRRSRVEGWRGVARLVGLVVVIGSTILALSTLLDYTLTGKLYFPTLSFLTQNLLLGISEFYGSNPWHYHLLQSLPILLTTSLPYFLLGLRNTLFPKSPKENNPALRILAYAAIWTTAGWSIIPHKEWRFLHPLLPLLLLFPTSYLSSTFTAPLLNPNHSPSLLTRASSLTRINRSSLLILLLTPTIPAIYLSAFHGRAQITVAEYLRTAEIGEKDAGVAVMMPCHSMPWASHVHREEWGRGEMWGLGCEPPIGVMDRERYRTEEQVFYEDPYGSVLEVVERQDQVTRVVLFGSLLDQGREGSGTVRGLLGKKGYKEAWSGWNGLDVLQDEEKRRGGVQVWALDDLVA